MSRSIKFLLGAFCLCCSEARAQTSIGLDFSNNVQATDGMYPNMSTLGPAFYSGHVFDFISVANVGGLVVDARVSITSVTPGYEFVGWLPDYNTDLGQPEGDLGFYYRFNGDFANATGSVSYRIDFFEGGGTFTNPTSLSNLQLLLYDVDGEPTQSEAVRTYLTDGLMGYRLNNSSGITAQQEADTMRFDSRNLNHSEVSPDGGVILFYENTSSIRFDMITTTFGGDPRTYGLFNALDGDLSLISQNPSNFAPFVATAVPEPTAPLLAAAGLIFLSCIRRRS